MEEEHFKSKLNETKRNTQRDILVRNKIETHFQKRVPEESRKLPTPHLHTRDTKLSCVQHLSFMGNSKKVRVVLL